MITGILTAFVCWCLFYGRLGAPVLTLLCAGLGTVIALLTRHTHTRFFKIDILAQISRLNKVNPTLKFWFALLLMAICLTAKTPVTGMFLAAVMLILIVYIGGLKIGEYLRLLALPVSFLMLSALALLFEVTPGSSGVINIDVLGFFELSVSHKAQIKTALVIGRALGCLSCLYMLSLTTPMSEIIGVLRRARCPAVITSLMYLIYRYVFILLIMYHTMRDAAKSRLGYTDYRASVRTTGNLYANLLSRSYRAASRNFDAMESRCFETDIRFLEHAEKVTAAQAITAVFIALLTAVLALRF